MYVNINLESIKTYRYSADASQSSDQSSFLKYQPSPFLQIFFPENKKSKTSYSLYIYLENITTIKNCNFELIGLIIRK